MLKNAKYRYISPARRTPLPFGHLPLKGAKLGVKMMAHLPLKGAKLGVKMMALLLVLLWGVAAQAQGYFTLTNGHYYWFGGTADDLDNTKYLTGFDQSNSWKEIRLLGTHATESTTEIVEQGTVYLALDTGDALNPHPASPTLQSISTDGGFNPLCVWYRSGRTGDYYQEWNGYKYFLIASHDEGLSVYRVAVNQPVSKATTWYDWDHGVAIEEEIEVPGGKKTRDYWLIYDTLNDADGTRLGTPEWRMSTVHCYQRPEEIIYSNYRANGLGGNTWDTMYYYDNVHVTASGKNYPAGVAATYMPVTKIDHKKDIDGGSPLHGLQVSTGEGNVDLEGYTMTYGDAPIEIFPDIESTAVMSVIPAYTEYREETYRRGVNLSGSLRTSDVFGSAGVPTTRTWYYYPDPASHDPNEPPSRYGVPPTSTNENPSVTSYVYTLDNRATRYLTVTPDASSGCTLTLFDRPMASFNAYLTCTVNYDNGVSISLTDTIHINAADVAAVVPHAKSAPVVRGSVFGGGKMANVTGNTAVTIHNTDSIYAVYGGNDIAGWVQGDDGATLQVGTRYTNENHPVHIGWLYGGGCGYYTYQGINVAQDDEGHTVDPYVYNNDRSNLMHSAYFFNGKVYKWNTVPSDYNAKASIVVERFNQSAEEEAAHSPRTYTDEQIMAPYYEAAWRDEDLVVDHTFNYIPYYYCDNEGHTRISFDESAETVDNTEDGNGSACMANKDYLGTVPYVKTAHVSIGVPEVEGHTDALGHNAHEHNDYILIDSLFGGAENAFIGVQTFSGDYASAITLDINGGTILAVFGGNNYGGMIAKTAMTLVNVNCTKMTDDESLVYNSYYHGMGRDFGIRHLFGGGNLVESSHAEVTFRGGMVDTAFIGGNRATVKNPVGVVDCWRDGTAYDLAGRRSGEEGFTRDFQNGHFIFTNPYMIDTTHNGRGNQHPDYAPDAGLYNVHFLFGGNNLAPMDNVSFIQLLSGGVGSVYGGGNQGDMTNDVPIQAAIAQHSGYIDIMPLVSTMFGVFDSSTLITPPSKIGSVIAASKRSKIIADYVYGGCRAANVKNSCGVYAAGGNYFDIIGGNDVSGDVGSEKDGSTYVVVTGDAVVQGNVYGGSDGYYHCEAKDNSGKRTTGRYDDTRLTYTAFNMNVDYDPYNDFVGMLIPTQQHANVFVNGGLVKGDVVAGGVMADIGFSNKRPRHLISESGAERDLTVGELKGTVRLELADTVEIRGNVYGGGSNASIWGLSQVYVKDSTKILGSLFAGNDCIGSIQSFLPYQDVVDYLGYYFEKHSIANPTQSDSTEALAAISHTDSLEAESANQAAQLSTAGDSLNKYVNTVGGIKQYNPRYSTYVRIDGTPIINSVYGSGNGAWDYDGTRPQFPTTFICSGNEGDRPDQKSAFIDIHTRGGFIDTVFGGGAGSTVTEDVVVLLNNTGTSNTGYPSPLPSGFLGGETQNYVGTIFGGNNFSDMNTVPEIRLVKGNVKNVYGGGNAGNMTKLGSRYDICGRKVDSISTYILSNSSNVTLTDSLFGGCRMSDIEGMAYVDIRNTSEAGFQYVYGGNDISGNVKGNTRIDMSGGKVFRMWGGSNGRYDYAPLGYGRYNVYYFGTYDAAHPEEGLIAVAGKPNVDSTHINLWGGTINASVFTGGSMADCEATCLVVDDQIGCEGTGNVTINGALYGGGEGRWDDLNARDMEGNRWGNVNGNTHVHLHHAHEVTAASAYGGGGGGNVHNTFIKTYPTWDAYFAKMFGGCWGSDVLGTAHLEFDGNDLVQELFGGNDFTGNVHRSEIVINSGNFGAIYGGGNGDYPDSYYNNQHEDALNPIFSYQNPDPHAYTDTHEDSVNHVLRHQEHPNTEFINITINDATVHGNLYGGGKMGTTWRYEHDANNVYLTNEYGRYKPDTNQVHTDPTEYSYIITNIHGGEFQRNVFGGGSGRPSNGGVLKSTGLVYGLKEVNMDGGSINLSLYGGSESVSDGYSSECVDKNTTTLRPSSIINFTGGTVESNLYGAGYLGMTNGSVYVNVGTDAIDSCVAYKKSYGSSDDSVYSIFKPGAEGSLVPALGKDATVFNHSIYAGANWGGGVGSNFELPGFNGGESIIIVDGKGYNTGFSDLNTDPNMNIAKSLFGSGTSVKGGDVYSRIMLCNYGELDNCHPTKELESVQRTGDFHSHHTAIHYLGASDATSAYISEPYSINRVDTMDFRGFNVAEYSAPLKFVTNVRFYEEAKLSNGSLKLVDVQTLREQSSAEACGESATMCGQVSVVDPDDVDKQHTVLILNDGIDFKIEFDEVVEIEGYDNYHDPGYVYGFGYVATPVGYSSSITALATAYYWKDEDPSEAGVYSWLDDFDDLEGYAGFVSPCSDSNRYTTDRGAYPLEWITSDDADNYVAEKAEVPYTNFIDEDLEFLNYREWKIGNGSRLRETTILAHSVPDSLEQNVSALIGGKHLALAKASLTLPAAGPNHYYTLSPGSINLSGPNLVDTAWFTTQTFTALDAAYKSNPRVDLTSSSTYGDWNASGNMGEDAVYTGVRDIQTTPANTFGLLMVPSEHFKTDGGGNYVMPGTHAASESHLVLSGNPRYNSTADYCSPMVTDADRVQPVMQFLLTYDTTFTTTFLGTVEFVLNEYEWIDANNDGVLDAGEEHLVGPINVKAYINTIIDEFTDMKTNVLAMFNNGTSNEFVRKVTLPITFDENRELYITSLKWEPTDSAGVSQDNDFFKLAEDLEDITGATPKSVNNLFRLELNPNDAVSTEINENVGWTSIDKPNINVFTLARATGSDPNKYAADGNATVDFTNNGGTDGLLLGVLDGRGSAAIDIKLNFDGERVYPDRKGTSYVGKAVLGMKWLKGDRHGDFTLTIYVKTREYGDTIYLASASQVSRNGYTVKPYSQNTLYQSLMASTTPADHEKAAKMVGKSPNCYVQSFQHALSSTVYQEGDIIAIIDPVNINGGYPVSIQGADGPAIQVMRYDGHHHELPDEEGVYRGPMIVVSGENSMFTTKNIYFHGGAGSLTKRSNRDGSGHPISGFKTTHSITVGGQNYNWTDAVGNQNHFEPDTNMVFGPILQVKDHGAVELKEGTIVRHNWNGYGYGDGQSTGEGVTANAEMMGAISVTDNGTLSLSDNVEIRDNFGHTMPVDKSGDALYDALRPGNGAIYVDGGTLVLPLSNSTTAVDITRNLLMNPAVHEGGASWWQMETINDGNGHDIPSRFSLDASSLESWQRANVLLTRTEPTSDDDHYKALNDVKTDVIQVEGLLAKDTRIGVRKWFPGPTERDTIRIAVSTSTDPTVMQKAKDNGNFESDDDFRVFYNPMVNQATTYLFRCATFQHQLASANYVAPVHDRYSGLELASANPLYFGAKGNVCPMGGDSIIYRVQGGLMPYTFTWSDPVKDVTLAERTTEYSNAQVEADLANTSLTNEERYAKYVASMADTMLLPYEAIEPTMGNKWNHLRVAATDATGECKLYKDIDLRILMDHNTTQEVTYWPKASTLADTSSHRDNSSPWRNDTVGTGWSDTSRTVPAVASRNFKGVQITPRVWVNRSDGNINAVVAGDDNDYVYRFIGASESHELSGLSFCPGDTITLYTEPRGAGTSFIMWDFDPYYKPLAKYAVPSHDATVTAYYGPGTYWYEHINTAEAASADYDGNYYYTDRNGHNYVTTYNGDVHIYNEDGLAWLISVVNGMNGQQARQFRFNTVYLHDKTGGYDMQGYLWTPVGTIHQPFRGWFVGVGSADADVVPLHHYNDKTDPANPVLIGDDAALETWLLTHDAANVDTVYDQVVIKNLIVNEPRMDYAGFFGNLDTALVRGIKIEAAMIRGSQYVGGLAASSKHSFIKDVAVAAATEDNEGSGVKTTTILSTHYTSGGMIGLSNHDTLSRFTSEAKYVGDAVYSGGVVGYGTSTHIINSQTRNDNRMSGLYIGGIAGYLDGTAPRKGGLFRRKRAGDPSVVMNNYVRLENNSALRVGGIVGYAKNSILENNYFYGDVAGANSSSGVASIIDGGSADGNFYQQGAAKQGMNSVRNNAAVSDTATFAGQGNQVLLSESVHGRNNLTRVLNAWVRERNAEGGNFCTWRSDLDNVNDGFPLFGAPDIIPAQGTQIIEGCDEVIVAGVSYTQDSSFTVRFIDSVEMVDSTLTALIILYHSTSTEVSDSAAVADGYDGYGFHITSDELRLLDLSYDSAGHATFVFSDTLSTVNGCDSVVMLTLTLTADPGSAEIEESTPVEIYPNPTTGIITVEARKMSHVEVYDNEGRSMQDYDADGSDKITIDLTYYASGVYYIRVHSPQGVVIQKVIKQ